MSFIDLVAQTATEKTISNGNQSKALVEEVKTHATKINQYENGQLTKAMANAVNKVVENSSKHGKPQC